jgi:NAD(P)-dependent dehydrogenase (short-subunit alcohol dehydrogenase family)
MLETSSKVVEVELLDLADLSSVRSFATRINEKLDSLDILINNAGTDDPVQNRLMYPQHTLFYVPKALWPVAL